MSIQLASTVVSEPVDPQVPDPSRSEIPRPIDFAFDRALTCQKSNKYNLPKQIDLLIGRLKGKPGKIAYGFGNLGQALTFHFIGAFLAYFYFEGVRLHPALVGLAFLISYGIWNSVNDPICGYISDRTRTRWGRRIPFVMFFTPLMVLFFILLWSPPIGGMPLPTPYDLWIFLFLLICLGIFELMYTFVVVGWNSLFPEMFEELKERAEVSIYRQVAAMIGLIIGFILAPFLIASLTGMFGTFGGWTLAATVIIFVSGGTFLISLLGSRERKEFSMAGTLPIKTAFKITFTNKSFVTAALCIMMTSWVWSFTSMMMPFLIVHMLRGTIGDVAFLMAPMILMTVLFYPFWRRICVRHGSKRTLTFSTLLSVLFLLPIFLVADTVLAAVAMMFFFGFALSGVTLTRELLMPDVIDEDEIKTGFRREGVYLGTTTFVDRFALALAGGSFALASTLTGFVPDVPPSPPVIVGLRVISSAILILALIGFLVSIKFYPIGAEKVAEIRETLEKVRKKERSSPTGS